VLPAEPPDVDAPAGTSFEFHSITTLWDNDGAYVKPFDDTDRHYTNGLKLNVAWRSPTAGGWADRLPLAGDFTNPALGLGLVVAQHIYTPDNIEAGGLQRDDRPYAGWLYAGVYLQRADARTFDHAELDLGIVGEGSGAEGVQKFVHAAVPNQPTPNGWGEQLSNEPTLQLTLERRWRTPRARWELFEFDAIPQVTGRLGNVFIDASLAVTGRAGINLPDDFGPPALLGARDATGTFSGDWSAYLFARAAVRGVAHNIFLDGNTTTSSHSVGRKPFVGEATVGVAGRWRFLEAGWSFTFLTEEFEGQSGGDSFGSFFLAYRARF
jgi:lipid A 3-O-deacylase